MIRLFCANRLAKALHLPSEPYTGDVPELDKWCVKDTIIRRQNVIVAMCADTRFGFILWGVKKAQYAVLPELIAEGIRRTFRLYGIRQEITDEYLSEVPMLCTGVSRQDSTELSRILAPFADTVYSVQNPMDMVSHWYVCRINKRPVYQEKDLYCPYERMLERLQVRYDMKPICRPAFELTAKIDLGSCIFARTLVVPAEYTFGDLHEVLQKAYDWGNRHPYRFIVNDQWISNEKPPLDHPSVLSRRTPLSSILEEGRTFRYTYENGDNWDMSIHVDSIKRDFDQPHPICTAAEGASPPEHLGGVHGFELLMQVYNDPKHPHYQEIKGRIGVSWSPEPNMEYINVILGNCLPRYME